MRVMRIQELRIKAGMTQASLGSAMGFAQCVISEWERETYLPKSRDLPLLARVLNCEISDLFVSECEEVS